MSNSDPADQKFLELAASSQTQALVTGERFLLLLDDKVSFEIIPPTEPRGRLHHSGTGP